MKITELQINCAHDKIVPLEELVPNPRNPNLHSPQQVEWIARVIKHRGWRAPIIVSNRSGFIVCGHGRLMAAKSMKLEGVPGPVRVFDRGHAANPTDARMDRAAHQVAEVMDFILAHVCTDFTHRQVILRLEKRSFLSLFKQQSCHIEADYFRGFFIKLSESSGVVA